MNSNFFFMIIIFPPELEAYAGVISALRSQGDLTKEKKDLLGELSKVLRWLFVYTLTLSSFFPQRVN